jgi:hypothetical protein
MIGTAIQSVVETVRGVVVPRVKGEQFAGDTLTADIYAPSGDDSPPLPDDVVFFSKDSTTGGLVYLGTLDQSNPTEAAAGEKRLYARTPSGAVAVALWLKGNGTIEIAGAADFAVRFAALNTQLQALVAAINVALGTKDDGAGTAGSLVLDLSTAKVDEVKLP